MLHAERRSHNIQENWKGRKKAASEKKIGSAIISHCKQEKQDSSK